MAFDDAKWGTPAIQGDLGRMALSISLAFDSIRDALINIKDGKDIDSQIDLINKRAKLLEEMFAKLTGYVPDAD